MTRLLTLVAATIAVAQANNVLTGSLVAPAFAQAETPSSVAVSHDAYALVRAAQGQVGIVTVYDPAYVSLSFPLGDVAQDRGVCTDVLVRALRVALGIDLQAAVNADMKADFSAYPSDWGLKQPDRNIDHRRVLNLRTLLSRVGAEVTDEYLPGDSVTSLLPGNLAHLVIVSDQMGRDGPMIVHNIGAGTQQEDRLFEFEITGHYRISAEVVEKLRALQGV